MNTKELRDKTIALISSIYDEASKLIDEHLDDNTHQSFGDMSEKVAAQLSVPLLLVKEIARIYVIGRGDIDIVKGPGGGLRRKKALEIKAELPKEEVPAPKQETLIKLIEKKIEPINLETAIKLLEPEDKKEDKKEEKVRDPNELPDWCVLKTDPMADRINSVKHWK